MPEGDLEPRDSQQLAGFVSVIGAGTMGSGIAQVIALSGLDVLLVDSNQHALDRASATIASSLDKLVTKGTVAPAEASRVLDSIVRTTRIDEAANSSVVIEAAFEDEAVKVGIFNQAQRGGFFSCLAGE